jgi:hypothetical protein
MVAMVAMAQTVTQITQGGMVVWLILLLQQVQLTLFLVVTAGLHFLVVARRRKEQPLQLPQWVDVQGRYMGQEAAVQ